MENIVSSMWSPTDPHSEQRVHLQAVDNGFVVYTNYPQFGFEEEVFEDYQEAINCFLEQITDEDILSSVKDEFRSGGWRV